MSLAAGNATIPLASGLVVAVTVFLAWAVLAVRSQRTEVRAGHTAPRTAATPSVAPARAPVRAPVRAVVRPHYVVRPPDAAAVKAAMAYRVPPPVVLRTPAADDSEVAPVRNPVPAGLSRSA